MALSGCQSGGDKYQEYNTALVPEIVEQADSIRLAVGDDAALYFISKGYDDAKKLSIRDWMEYYHFKFLILKEKDPQKALFTADSFQLLLEKNSLQGVFPSEYMTALYSKGDAFFELKEYNQAFDYYYKGKLVAEDKLSECEKGDFSFRVAMVLFQQKRYEEAAEYFKDCYRKMVDCGHQFLVVFRAQEVLDNAGLSYSRAGANDSALVYFNKCIHFIEDVKGDFADCNECIHSFDEAVAVAEGNMATVFFNQGKYAAAEELLLRSIQENGLHENNPLDAEFSLLKLAELYINTKALDKADNAFRQLDIMLDSVPNVEANISAYHLKSDYYAVKGDAAAALSNLRTFVNLNEHRQRDSRKLGKNNLVERVSMLESTHKIEVLQHENDSKAMYLMVEGLVLVMAILIFILIYNNWRKSRRYIKLLTGLNNKARQQRKELKIALEQLEKSNKGKDRILRIVAHDIRNPIAGISMLAEMLLHEDGLNEEQLENLKLIKVSCENALTLSREILEVATEFMPEKWIMERVDITALLQTQIEILRFRAAEKKQTILLSVPDHQVWVVLNSEKMGRVISNLVMNAIKFSGEGTEIEVSAKEHKDNIVLVVKDQGIGVPENMKDKIFDMFTDAKRFGTKGEKPFGLGLSICKQIVEAHGGRIWLESIEDVGTSFFVSIPYDYRAQD